MTLPLSLLTFNTLIDVGMAVRDKKQARTSDGQVLQDMILELGAPPMKKVSRNGMEQPGVKTMSLLLRRWLVALVTQEAIKEYTHTAIVDSNGAFRLQNLQTQIAALRSWVQSPSEQKQAGTYHHLAGLAAGVNSAPNGCMMCWVPVSFVLAHFEYAFMHRGDNVHPIIAFQVLRMLEPWLPEPEIR